MEPTYIVAAARTPIGKFGGAFIDLSPVELAAHAMRAALSRAAISGDLLDLYIVGNILKHGHGQLLPRQAALAAGICRRCRWLCRGYALLVGDDGGDEWRSCHSRRRGRLSADGWR